MWFKVLTGFDDDSHQSVHDNIEIDQSTLWIPLSEKEYQCGTLEIISLADLKRLVKPCELTSGVLKVSEIISDVQSLHLEENNHGALFQVASQFNLLEMASEDVTPDEGIDIYEYDFTQGPACSIACGAGTIYRNYFLDVNGHKGQSAKHQINCLDELGRSLGNTDNKLWKMVNGYVMPSEEGLKEVNKHLAKMGQTEIKSLKHKLKLGIHWNTQVTMENSSNIVSQIFCSALPVSYSGFEDELWEPFARIILEAAYEATICAALINLERTGNNTLFLTLLGGGAFGNDEQWIKDAIVKALQKYNGFNLDVFIVSRGSSQKVVREIIEEVEST